MYLWSLSSEPSAESLRRCAEKSVLALFAGLHWTGMEEGLVSVQRWLFMATAALISATLGRLTQTVVPACMQLMLYHTLTPVVSVQVYVTAGVCLCVGKITWNLKTLSGNADNGPRIDDYIFLMVPIWSYYCWGWIWISGSTDQSSVCLNIGIIVDFIGGCIK